MRIKWKVTEGNIKRTSDESEWYETVGELDVSDHGPVINSSNFANDVRRTYGTIQIVVDVEVFIKHILVGEYYGRSRLAD